MGLYLGNSAALGIIRHLNQTTNDFNRSLERLSSGFRFTAPGEGTTEKTTAVYHSNQSRGSAAAIKNADAALELLQTADTALDAIEEHLSRVRELATSVGSTGLPAETYTAANAEIAARFTAINTLVTNTTVNGVTLFDNVVTAYNVQVGLGGSGSIDIGTSTFIDSRAQTLTGVGAFTTISAGTAAADAATVIGQVTTGLTALASRRANVGQQTNTLTSMKSLLQVHQENSETIATQLVGTDVAQETATMTRLQITQQAGIAALAQANQSSSMVLRLLGYN